jgi:hypothetical protein
VNVWGYRQDDVSHLGGKLSGWGDYQREGSTHIPCVEQTREDWEHERKRLAASGLRLRNDIVPLKHNRDRSTLHRGWDDDFELLKPLANRWLLNEREETLAPCLGLG